ncbi:unnamed protein product [Bursaphelenchus xylophilus]|uniref:(pine wood nematode) hypothetical protein n=1 Tax=Bursaphelenchus xylophilus TaxID=6326 RepID=A0A1I7S4W7_BURXY|nr:unnamed protein product [Bursaphelenchus xylophilus]CAG9117439.1 unnamed protein product [Bursaphelenchus xylophilus]
MDSTQILDALVTTEIIFTAASLLISVYIVFKFRHITTLHGNFRLVLSYALVGGNVFNISHLYLYPRVIEFYKLNEFGSYDTTLDIRFAAICYWTGAVIALTKFLLLCLERFLATAYRTDYEHRGTCIGWTMITIHIVISLAIGFTHLSAYDICVAYTESCDGYCERSCAMSHFFYDGNTLYIAISFLVGLVCWVLGIVEAIVLFIVNKKLGTQLDTLSLRFQYRENLETLKAMLPGVTIYGIMELICCTAVVYVMVSMQDLATDDVGKQILFHITYVAMASYNLFFSLYNLLGYPPLSVAFINDLRAIICMKPLELSAVVAPKEVRERVNEKQKYFEYVNRQWK